MPIIRYHCSECDHEFELNRPANKATDNMSCPKCGHQASPSSNFQGKSPAARTEASPIGGAPRELPRWAKGQVEAQIRQMIGGSDTVAGQEVELITQKVLRELGAAGLEPTPGNIKTLAQKHMAGLDSWANIARRSGAKMDAAAKLDDED